MINHKAFASTRVIALMLGATFIASGKGMADFVIADDLIVQGSACVGLDCVNGEAFSFDTIRLKENNTRIKFDDTSTGAGFPNNDWQLTANNRRARLYRITRAGQKRLDEEHEKWDRLTKAVGKVLRFA